jgi:molecular chaperone GrpE (heat shock protein)
MSTENEIESATIDLQNLQNQYDELKKNYEDLQKKHQATEENQQKVLRTAAHVQNLYNELKEKSIKDLDREKKRIQHDIFHRIIKFIDMLELTLDSINQQKTSDKSIESIVNGINMVYKYIISDLENHFKLKKIDCKVGDSFDSQTHEAQKSVSTDDESKHNTIAKIISCGYILNNEVLTNPVVDVAIFG